MNKLYVYKNLLEITDRIFWLICAPIIETFQDFYDFRWASREELSRSAVAAKKYLRWTETGEEIDYAELCQCYKEMTRIYFLGIIRIFPILFGILLIWYFSLINHVWIIYISINFIIGYILGYFIKRKLQ